jgi:ATP-dependent protease Clp ATPase subunit
MKISVPKEAITQIMADYNCTEEEAAKAYLDAQERAGEAFQSFLENRFSSQKMTSEPVEPKIYTPKEIKKHLDKYVISESIRKMKR